MTAPMAAAAFATAMTPVQPDIACAPHELSGLLDRYPGVKVLSLDCFDTLLWRDGHAPRDVFAALPGVLPLQRAAGESRARQLAAAARGLLDVSLDMIYGAIMPRADARARAAAIVAELAAETRHCHAFAPVVTLMREARWRNIKVIVVSDTYFDQHQLLQLIGDAAGADVAALIDQVFCSCSFGRPKAGGLYQDVLARVKARPDEILHIGDNHKADVIGVKPFGVHTVHLVQFEPEIARQLRMEGTIATMLFGSAHGCLTRPQPHRAALALGLPQESDPARRLGQSVLGPLFFGFDAWLRKEAAELAEQGLAKQGLAEPGNGNVHWLFLMRDGFLPMRVHQATGSSDNTHAIEISRMTATFASIADDAALKQFLAQQALTTAPALGKLLRLDDATIAAICGTLDPVPARAALEAWCHEPMNARRIIADARALRTRVIAHVRQVVNPAPGDTLMLVDLGYNGSVQTLVGPLLADALDVTVAGRYLLLFETELSGLDKRGLIDRRHLDDRALATMVGNVAVLEQLSTTAIGSVIDYAEDGTPIRAANSVKPGQSEIRDMIQAGCIEFLRHQGTATIRANPSDDHDRLWREACAAAMTRLMFLPLQAEIETITAFEHDLNLGTDQVLGLFDKAEARRGLRQKGLVYQQRAWRMFVPGELVGEGMPLRLANFATQRFDAPLTFGDAGDGATTVPVVLVQPGGEVQAVCPARPTHDGFHALCIPLGSERHPVAVQIGAAGRHIEVETIIALPTSEYLCTRPNAAAREVAVVPLLDGIVEYAPRLWQCQSEYAFAFLQPPEMADCDDLMVVMVYRVLGE